MIGHKYVVGAQVELLPNRANCNVRPGVYTILRVMPVTNNGCQYRAKNAIDNHERVLDEAELRPM